MLSAMLKHTLSAALVLGMTLGALTPTVANAEVLLTVEMEGAEAVTYTRDDLNALPRVTFETSTIWTEGVKEFSGVSLKLLLDKSGITSGMVRAVAINDYIVEIPVESLEADYPIVADQIDGAEFSRREKGPLWIVYPYDHAASYRTEENFGRSVWQVVRLTQQ